MLRLDLSRLAREGNVRVEAQVTADDLFFTGSDVGMAGPVSVQLTATYAGSGEIVVRGSVSGTVRRDCRRCLEPVVKEVREELTMVFVPSDSDGAEEDGDVRVIGDAAELDLRDPVREEVLLAIDPYVVCDPKCRGLCPRCGTNLNNETCSCTEGSPDPRWDALRALKEE